ncbi:Hypothetical predicted protein [Paramuricea clavata]|uniref:Uncharacterized protein n=1 Tax=Paramuricea clavata TaxID=317549 RepID=A0A7D9L6K1_PARCT|nr:Hypothetical predicted protein [Paramuricea clavata]
MPEFGVITKQEESRRKGFDNQRAKRNSSKNFSVFGTRVNQGNKNDKSTQFSPETFGERTAVISTRCPVFTARKTTTLLTTVKTFLRREVLTYALLDDQSNAVLVKESVFERLVIEASPTNIKVSTVLSKDQLIVSYRVRDLEVSDYHHQKSIRLSTAYIRDDLPSDDSDIPKRRAASQWDHLKDIAKHIPEQRKVEIGFDRPKCPASNENQRKRYDLGWTIIGDVCKGPEGNDSDKTFKINRIVIRDSATTKEIYTPSDVQRMMELDYSERKAEREDNTIHSVEDHKFLQILEEGIKKDTDGRWEMPLPFRDKTPLHLPDNRPHCLRRMMSLKRKFEKDPKLFKDYSEFMEKIISKGHASKVEDSAHEFQPKGDMTKPIKHLFGAVSSPGCANFGLRKTVQDGESEFGKDIANFVRTDFYVDDGLKSVKTTGDAINLITKSQAMCAKAGLCLHKFASNSVEVLEAVPAEDRAKEIKDLDLRHDTLPIQRSLGTYWCIESDTFQFRITLKDKPFTRQGILSTVSSVYDPLGIVCPVILTGKLLLRELVQQKADCDDPVPEEIRPRWEKWRAELKDLEKLETHCCLKPPSFGEVKSTEIHSFADASQSAVG